MNQRDRKRNDDHAGEGKVQVHGGCPWRFGKSIAILIRPASNEKFGFLIPMIEGIDDASEELKIKLPD